MYRIVKLRKKKKYPKDVNKMLEKPFINVQERIFPLSTTQLLVADSSSFLKLPFSLFHISQINLIQFHSPLSLRGELQTKKL